MAHWQDRRRWVAAGWVAAVLATALNGLVVGYGAVWFQLFGDRPDAADYRVSAGGYGAAAVVLALAVVALITHDGPRWLAWVAGASSLIETMLSLQSLDLSREAEPALGATSGLWDGVGGVVWAPWTWVLVGLAIRGLFRRSTGSRSRGLSTEARLEPRRRGR